MAEEILESHGTVKERQIVGIVAGTRTRSGATNFMRLHMIGDRDTEPVSSAETTATKKPEKKKAGKPAKKKR
jgi:pyruvate kinase